MFRNELGKGGMAHRVDNLDDVSINYIMYPCHYGTLVAMTSGDYRCRFEGKFKTLRSLPSGHGIELGFSHSYRITSLTLEKLNWQKWANGDFSKNNLS